VDARRIKRARRRADPPPIGPPAPPSRLRGFRLGFALVVLCSLVGLAALGGVALHGNAGVRAASHQLHDVGGRAALDNATWAYLMDFKGGLAGFVGTDDPALRDELGDLVEQRVELIDRRLAIMHRRYPDGTDGSRLTSAQELPYRQLHEIWRRWSARPLRSGPREDRVRARALVAIRAHGTLMADSGEASSRGDERVAEEAEALAALQFRETRVRLIVALLTLLAAGAALAVWFGRSVVPAIERERAERRDAADQALLHTVLRPARDGREAGAALASHLSRHLPGAGIVVLVGGSGQDSLETLGSEGADPVLTTRLETARARDCLALRHGLAQESAAGDRLSLTGCGVCGKLPGATACVPLRAGSEATGSVLVHSSRPIGADERRRLHRSAEHAAPVITNLRELADARSRAATDALTGLPNRRAFEDTARRMVAQASRSFEPLAAVLVDLDHFKAVNDTFGHAAGDDALICVASCLTGSVRAGDFVARLGGEEFALLLPGASREGALLLADSVRQAVARLAVPGVDRPITASLGVALIPDHAGDADAVVARADEALYAAKAAGRDRVVPASGGASAPESARVSL